MCLSIALTMRDVKTVTTNPTDGATDGIALTMRDVKQAYEANARWCMTYCLNYAGCKDTVIFLAFIFFFVLP